MPTANSEHVVLLNWSLGGKVLQPAFKAVSAAGLTDDGAISMLAALGIAGLSLNLGLKKTPGVSLATGPGTFSEDQ